MASRQYPYLIELVFYSGKLEHHFIHAENYRDAFDKAHKFCNPFNPHDGVQFINVKKLTKAICAEMKIEWED